MPVHLLSLTVPANTAESALSESARFITRGEVLTMAMHFPPGSKGLLYAKVLLDRSQLWPIDLNEYWHGDNITFEYAESFKIAKAQSEITLQAYNLDDTYQHEVSLSFSLIPESSLLARLLGSIPVSVPNVPGQL